jgi:hypothetical protein
MPLFSIVLGEEIRIMLRMRFEQKFENVLCRAAFCINTNIAIARITLVGNRMGLIDVI